MALGIYLLELFVAFVQAYIFTMLSSLFIGRASRTTATTSTRAEHGHAARRARHRAGHGSTVLTWRGRPPAMGSRAQHAPRETRGPVNPALCEARQEAP